MYHYQLFGLNVESEILFTAIENLDSMDTDVSVFYGIISREIDHAIISENDYSLSERQFYMKVENVGEFRVDDGKSIIVHPFSGVKEDLIRLYVLGTCFGVLLQQRGIVSIHGSCISNGERTILITGNSGCGKSTLASMFLQNGWKLISDDVIPIYIENDNCYAQATYPGQKLWKDTLEQLGIQEKMKSLLYVEDGCEKYQINAEEYFWYTRKELTDVVMLTKGTDQLYISEVTGFAKTDLLLRNIYRRYMVVDQEGRENQLRTCMKLSSQVRSFLIERPEEERTEETIYQAIVLNNA